MRGNIHKKVTFFFRTPKSEDKPTCFGLCQFFSSPSFYFLLLRYLIAVGSKVFLGDSRLLRHVSEAMLVEKALLPLLSFSFGRNRANFKVGKERMSTTSEKKEEPGQPTTISYVPNWTEESWKENGIYRTFEPNLFPCGISLFEAVSARIITFPLLSNQYNKLTHSYPGFLF